MVRGIDSFFLIDSLPSQFRVLHYRYLILQSGGQLAFGLLSTYLILYILESLDFYLFGIVLAVKLIIQTVLDYPSGTIGDVIGQHRVFAFAYIAYIGALVSLYFAGGFGGILLGYIFFALANSQESGALESWFANNYQPVRVAHDTDRTIFGAFLGRIETLNLVIFATMIIGGGLLADSFGRRSVILVSLVFVILTLIAIVSLMSRTLWDDEQSDDSDLKVQQKPTRQGFQQTLRQILNQSKLGIRFLFSHHGILLFYVGLGFTFSVGSNIWGELILFPLYLQYAKDNATTGIMRATIMVLGILWSFIISKYSRNIKNERRGFVILMINLNFVFFFLVFLFYTVFPPQPDFSLSLFIGVILVFQTAKMIDPFYSIFYNRIQLSLVPDHIRNAVYSLLPTIITAFGIPMALLGGYVIDNISFGIGILLSSVLGLIGVVIMAYGLMRIPKELYSPDLSAIKT